jgi:hypothetical protein
MSAQAFALDVEVYADRHAEMLEELEAEHNQALEDAAEFEAFNAWADQAVQTLPDWPVVWGAA